MDLLVHEHAGNYVAVGGLRDYAADRLLVGVWHLVFGEGLPVPALVRVGTKPDGTLACTGLVLGFELDPRVELGERPGDPGSPALRKIGAGEKLAGDDLHLEAREITSRSLAKLKIGELLRDLKSDPRLNFDLVSEVTPPERHPGRAGHGDAVYRAWAKKYRALARKLRRKPTWRDLRGEGMQRATFYRYRRECLRRGLLKEHE